ncbi:hypothetical protein MNEG_4433 [Monoraphidium neglectum]|uniref:Uncharacterized protein n=1 Tax=Monoraphidium neglectum TaxID=145388 RepID=A0A0D2NE64_9CHLO|nr:hypothetical protein MNEG_4433 [Monoraphidium neglectum]KIZ03531.1 hypothetical protein MNEG_4433 [Monoraphidium neglectum]|eukprot:XP_013902550.1 hypothetical protein MNEG_4433 [Monoraphidium neglectum]
MVFMAPPAGRYDLVLHLMSSTWVGADLAMPAKLRVATLTRAVAEGRDPKANERKRFDSDSDDDGEDRHSAASGSEEEGSDEEGSGDDYDSEETGELESSDGGEDGDADEDADEDGGDGGKAGAAAGKKDK